jgi:hypothetical protein
MVKKGERYYKNKQHGIKIYLKEYISWQYE